MSGFSIDWLDLREGADHRARDQALLERARSWLLSEHQADSPPLVVDLGAGTGSTLRAFAQQRPGQEQNSSDERLPVQFSWRLVDNDRALLAEASRRHSEQWQLEVCPADFAQPVALPLANARLITASALFDLVSANFITALAGELKTHSVGIYAALNYDGTTQWTPAHPLDGEVLQAFNRDQRRDKGMGPALGPDATATMQTVFTASGFRVFTASSPWLLTGDDRTMVSALLAGIHEAVQNDPALDKQALSAWREFRESHVATGTCEVGHQDFLALPSDSGAPD